MKILIALCICIVSSSLLWCQKGSLQIGLVMSYERVDYQIRPIISLGFAPRLSNKDVLNRGLSINYQISDKLMLTSGALLSGQEVTQDYNWMIVDSDDPFLPESTTLGFNNLRVPLMIGQVIVRENVDVIPSMGLNFDILLNSYETTIFEDDSERDSDYFMEGLSNLQAYLTLDFFVRFKPSDKLSVGLAPFFNLGLNNVNDYIIGSKATNIGGRFSIAYNLLNIYSK